MAGNDAISAICSSKTQKTGQIGFDINNNEQIKKKNEFMNSIFAPQPGTGLTSHMG